MDKTEAIKILKDFHDKSALFSVRTALEALHPEFKESEDEKNRREIIGFIRNAYWTSNRDRFNELVAWLEKKGNQNHIEQNLEMVEALRTEYEKGRADAIAEMQVAWSEEDENKIDTIISVYRPSPKLVKWLKSIKQRYKWKPSDEQITVLELASKYERVFTPKQIDILIGLKEQLKKLKGQEV